MFERVKEISQEQLNLDGVEITEASSFKDDLMYVFAHFCLRP